MSNKTLSSQSSNTLSPLFYKFKFLLSNNSNIYIIHKAEDILFFEYNSLLYAVERKLINLTKHKFRSDYKYF